MINKKILAVATTIMLTLINQPPTVNAATSAAEAAAAARGNSAMLSTRELREVLDFIRAGEGKIAESEGKDVVVFIGRTGVGKSTTINALLTGKLEEGDDDIIPAGPAHVGDGIVGDTLQPILYHVNGRLAFLDTMGFEDVRENTTAEIGSSILLEMALKPARTVKLVCLVEHGDFKNLSKFKALGQTLQLIVGPHREVPILFMANKYTPSTQKKQREFNSKDEAGQQELAKQATHEAIRGLLDGHLTTLRQFEQRFLQRDVTVAPRENKEYQESVTKMDYIAALKFNFDNGNFGYINPTSAYSVQSLMRFLTTPAPTGLPVVNMQHLVFTSYNSEYVRFFDALNNQLARFFPLIMSMERASRYPINLLNGFITKCEEALHGLSANPDTLPDEDTLDAQKKDIQRRLALANQRLGALNSEIARYSAPDPIRHEEYPWNVSAWLFQWWRNYACRYKSSLPFERVEEELAEHTHRKTLVRNDSPFFEADYTSDVFHGCSGKLVVLVKPEVKNAALLREKSSELTGLESQLGRLNTELEEAGKKSLALIWLGKKITSEQAIAFANRARGIYNAHRNEIDLNLGIIGRLGIDRTPEGAQETAKAFLQQHRALQVTLAEAARRAVNANIDDLIGEIKDNTEIGEADLERYHAL